MRFNLKSVLWDFNEEKVATLSQDFVIQRTLTYGTISLIIESIREHGIAEVRKVFEALKPTAINAKKYLYLKNYLLK